MALALKGQIRIYVAMVSSSCDVICSTLQQKVAQKLERGCRRRIYAGVLFFVWFGLGRRSC